MGSPDAESLGLRLSLCLGHPQDTCTFLQDIHRKFGFPPPPLSHARVMTTQQGLRESSLVLVVGSQINNLIPMYQPGWKTFEYDESAGIRQGRRGWTWKGRKGHSSHFLCPQQTHICTYAKGSRQFTQSHIPLFCSFTLPYLTRGTPRVNQETSDTKLLAPGET